MMRSISSKLLLSYIAIILVTTLTSGLLLSYLLRNFYIETKRQDMLSKGYEVAAVLRPFLSHHDDAQHFLFAIGNLTGANTLWIVDMNGEPIAGTVPPRWAQGFAENRRDFDALMQGEPQTWIHLSHRQNTDPSIVVAIPIDDGNTVTAAVFLHTPVTGIDLALAQLHRLLIYAALAGAMAAFLLMLFLSRAFTRPIAAIASAATAFAKGNFSARVAVTTRDEIGKLGLVFNNMAEDLAKVEQNRRDFLANVTHELKTPITSIRGFTEAILDGYVDSPEQSQRYLNNILSETERINRLVNDLLDLSRIQAGQVPIRLQPVELDPLLHQVVENQYTLYQAKEITVTIKTPPRLPPVCTDKDRLSQIVANLFNNAVRYSPVNGAICIVASLAGPQITVAISDNGPGIPLEDLPHIWDRFYRVEKSRAREHGGTGIGLAIVKSLVLAMGGSVAAENRIPVGSTFSFSLPIAGKGQTVNEPRQK